MKKILATVLTAATFALGANVAKSDEGGMFTVITNADDQTRMMALVLTRQAVDRGREARILLCSYGAELALQDYEGPSFEPAGRNPQQMLQGLINDGVQVEVCAIYLPQADADESDLIDGVGAAKPPQVGEYMGREDVRYFTF